ncbi:MAG: hypothetical protein V6Z86_07535 [Hyphomicrobiales bacterium]
MIFINSSPRLTVNDVIELLVHEFTHNLLFIDETNHVQFDYDSIMKPDYFSKSAILNTQRPLDKVVHSIVVSAQIIIFRQRYGKLYKLSQVSIHPKTDVMLETTQEAIAELLAGENKRKLMTDHTIELVEQARDRVFQGKVDKTLCLARPEHHPSRSNPSDDQDDAAERCASSDSEDARLDQDHA